LITAQVALRDLEIKVGGGSAMAGRTRHAVNLEGAVESSQKS
jgi:hypothetical protein